MRALLFSKTNHMAVSSASARRTMCFGTPVSISAEWSHDLPKYRMSAALKSGLKSTVRICFTRIHVEKMLPVGASLLVRIMFRAGKQYSKECRKTRIDIDKRLRQVFLDWQPEFQVMNRNRRFWISGLRGCYRWGEIPRSSRVLF